MKRVALTAALLGLALLVLTSAPAVAVDLAGYRTALQAAHAALDADDPDAGQALGELRAIDVVTLDDGTTIEPDLSAIVTALEAEPPDIAAARTGIATMLSTLERAEQGGLTDEEAARAALGEVLAREEFHPAEDESASLAERINRWINDLIVGIFEWFNSLAGDGGTSPASIVTTILGVSVIVGVVAFAVRSVKRSVSPRVYTLEGAAVEEHYTSAHARAEAERLLTSGEYRAALRMLYLATLIRWEEAGRLRFDRSLTNREVLARVTLQGDAPLLEQLSPLVDRFDRVWYGGAACTSDDYASFASLADRAWKAA